MKTHTLEEAKAAIIKAYDEVGHNDDWNVRVVYLDLLLEAIAHTLNESNAETEKQDPLAATGITPVRDPETIALDHYTEAEKLAWSNPEQAKVHAELSRIAYEHFPMQVRPVREKHS